VIEPSRDVMGQGILARPNWFETEINAQMEIRLFVRFISVACLSFSLTASSSASINLTLFTDAPPSSPLSMLPNSLSAPITVGVVNDATPNDPADFLTGWQLSLSVIPEPGATGTVTFASPIGSIATKPLNYLLDGVNFGIGVTNTGNALTAFDFKFPFNGGSGVEVTTDPGAALLELLLLASADASGLFGIYALPDLDGSEWADATPNLMQRREFANVLDGLGPVKIGAVLVATAVPEPSMLTIFSVIILACFLVFHPRYEVLATD